MTLSPETLAAYADGELDAATARRVEAEIAGSEQLQAALAAHRALRARLSAHFAPIAEQPVPDRLRQAAMVDIEAPEVIDFIGEAQKRRAHNGGFKWGQIVGPALAASLVLALIGYGIRSSGGHYAQGGIAEALDGQLVATQAVDAPVRILLTVRDKEGRYCRGFTGSTSSGLACRDDHGWRLLRTFRGAGASAREYRQAGNADEAVMAALQDLAAGPALDASEELQAAHNGWHKSPNR